MRMVKNGITFIAIALIMILGFTVYSNSLNNKFIWDDYSYVKDNMHIRNWSNIPKIFSEDIGAGAEYKSNFYRPFQMITYMIDYSLWKLNVRGYHITNTLLHVAVALSVYWLINILYKNRLLSLLTSFLFVVHPIHTEAIAFISGRADPLSSLFMLLCLIFYIRYLRLENIMGYILISLSYVLALLSKENSIILPLLILLFHYAFKEEIKIKKLLPILAISFIYILFRAMILKSLLPPVPSLTILLQRIPGFFVAITNYLKLMFLPFDLHRDYGNRLFSFTNPKAILGLVILFLSATYAFIKRNSDKVMFFSASWFFLTLLPVSNIYPINDSYMLEHWLYLPSIGFFLILADKAYYLYKIERLQVLLMLFITCLIVFYSYLTIQQNNYWKEPIFFYERSLKYTPDNWKFYNELGIEYANIGKNEKAISLYKKALDINQSLCGTYYNLGNAYAAIGKNEEAVSAYKKAIELNPNYAIAYNNLSIVYLHEKQYKSAIEYCDKARELGFINTVLLETLKQHRERKKLN